MNRPLTVIIADDHAIVREGLKLLISAMTDVSILAEAANGEALLDIVRDTRADLLTLDLGMPGVAGIQFIAEIRTLAPRMRILVLTANVEPRTVRAALEAGANGYLTKDGDPEELDQAIAALKSGRTYLAKSIRFAVERPERPGKVPVTGEIVSPIPLTLRERQILLLSAQGLTAKLMAERLGISPLTARKHRENLMRKLSLHSTAEVTAYAVRLGLPVG
ncbi:MULTISPECIES: response regulator transcription factor [unclassified Rhizobium]|jgi:DNA-binding NarL/FixJ family response regulator|uniref:response regulator n=1 Tax=unclassified Rhizobium TaxID=2613769 RepID=UPI000647A526|nr:MULTISPECIES: response regulator transcription factor [unclassified Rhizobium]MBN8954475.1 response regulator transcription factor [Rhizobium tropici]OJY77606.1 MAG: DNA-binding response regulator [Rhizobium sp. 60-20]RKD56167.1 LuxR family two component transcriptional regulator [Rhizobium sp. WW_1]